MKRGRWLAVGVRRALLRKRSQELLQQVAANGSAILRRAADVVDRLGFGR